MRRPGPRVIALLALAALVTVPAPAASPGAPAALPAATDVVRVDVENVETLPPESPRLANVTVTFCAASSGLVAGPRQMTVDVPDAPAWLNVTTEPATFTFALVLPGECDTASGVMRFNASRSAPAFEIVTVDVEARDARNGTTYERVPYHFRVGFHGAMVVTPERGSVTAPQDVPVAHAVRVKNLGNAESTFRLHVAGSRDDVQIVLPRALTLAPGASGTWDVHVVVPSGTGLDTREVQLLVTSHARLDHEALGESEVLHVTVHPERNTTAHALPAPGTLWVVAIGLAIAAAVAAARAPRRT